MDAIGERLREERLRNGWSQKDLARESKINVDTISGIETGQHEPRPSTLTKLAKALSIEVRDLFAEPALAGKAEAPATGRLPGWATTTDLNVLNQNVSEVPTEELHNLVKRLAQNLRWNRTLEGVRSEPRSVSHARVLNRARTDAIVAELLRRGEEPPEEYLISHRQWQKAMEPPSEAEPQSDTGRNIPEAG